MSHTRQQVIRRDARHYKALADLFADIAPMECVGSRCAIDVDPDVTEATCPACGRTDIKVGGTPRSPELVIHNTTSTVRAA